MFIYLDTCCLQRPLDDRSQPRINIEAEAILTILGIIEKGHASLVSSEVLDFEASRIPDEDRKNKAKEILSIASKYVALNDEMEFNASKYVKEGIKPVDALHLSSAIATQVDYFCTVDDKFLYKAKRFNTHSTKVISPLELIMEIAK